jgi:hypothetical protein
VKRVALILRCTECEAAWLPADEERWRAYLCCDEDLDEVAEFVLYSPAGMCGEGVRGLRSDWTPTVCGGPATYASFGAIIPPGSPTR